MSWRKASFAVTLLASVLALAGAGLGTRSAAPARALVAAGPAPAAVVEPDQGFGLAPPGAPPAHEVSRRVLALYDSSELHDDDDKPVKVSSENALAHRLAELPLAHLGIALDYWDVDGELPPPSIMARYRGVLAWFGDNRMRRPEAYLRWLAGELAAGRRVVVMEGLGATEDLRGHPANAELIDRVMQGLGARRALAAESLDSSQIAVLAADRAMVGFEAPLPGKLDYYERLVAQPGARVYLRIGLTGEPDSSSDAIFTSAHGGYALRTLVWREDRISDRWVTRWLIDPFRFFETAFGLEGMPRVDFTTLNGERLFYSQIDGDGMDTLTELDYKSRCGEIVRDQILARYPLPFTASVVVGYTAPPPVGKGNPTEVAIARSIFALDNVEVGSHGYAHPLDWRDKSGKEVSVAGLPGWQMSGEWEVAKSVEYINRELAPPNKQCRIMLWTGDCNPASDELAVAYRLGLRNLNGGDPRMDAHFPSYAHLVSPVHTVGGLAQYYTSAANDYILTNEWKPPFYRFRNVIQSFERSGAPRRMVPVDVYFHFYSARNGSALTALREVLDWSMKQPLAPVYASEYVDIVRDAESARLSRVDAASWRIEKGPALRTVRFDDPTVHVDIARSRGVIGYLQEPSLHATYVHLDNSTVAILRLQKSAPTTPFLERASHAVDELRVTPAEIAFATHGFGQHRFVFAGLPAGSRWILDGNEAVVDAAGKLSVAKTSAGATRVSIRRAS